MRTMLRRLVPLTFTILLAACGAMSDDGPKADADTVSHGLEGVAGVEAPDPDAYGRVLYVPAYSHIYHARQDRVFQLTITLSVRNPFPWRSVTIHRIDYFDSSGDFVRGYLDRPRVLAPLETIEVVVARDDETGGSGANFLVGFEGAAGEPGPLVEAVMVGTLSGQGVSFSTSATEVVRP